MILRRCKQFGCREYVQGDKRYCPKHERQRFRGRPTNKIESRHYNQTKRDPETNAFYQSEQWQRCRQAIYARDQATCQVCGDAIADRKIVDHIVPLKVDFDKRLDADNLWVLCYRCHNIKTRIEFKLTKKNQNYKLKHLSRDWWKKTLKERLSPPRN